METTQPLTRIVQVRIPHAPFVEFGTGRRGAANAPPGKPDNYVYGARAGMTAQPYMFPAAEKNRQPFERDAADAIRQTAKG